MKKSTLAVLMVLAIGSVGTGIANVVLNMNGIQKQTLLAATNPSVDRLGNDDTNGIDISVDDDGANLDKEDVNNDHMNHDNNDTDRDDAIDLDNDSGIENDSDRDDVDSRGDNNDSDDNSRKDGIDVDNDTLDNSGDTDRDDIAQSIDSNVDDEHSNVDNRDVDKEDVNNDHMNHDNNDIDRDDVDDRGDNNDSDGGDRKDDIDASNDDGDTNNDNNRNKIMDSLSKIRYFQGENMSTRDLRSVGNGTAHIGSMRPQTRIKFDGTTNNNNPASFYAYRFSMVGEREMWDDTNTGF